MKKRLMMMAKLLEIELREEVKDWLFRKDSNLCNLVNNILMLRAALSLMDQLLFSQIYHNKRTMKACYQRAAEVQKEKEEWLMMCH
jgi:hypothetical protein